MAGKETSSQQLRTDLRKTLKIFARRRAIEQTKDDRLNVVTVAGVLPEAPAPSFGLQNKRFESFRLTNAGWELQGLRSDRAPGAAGKVSESLHEKVRYASQVVPPGAFSLAFGEAAQEVQDEQEDALETVARELDVIATAVEERYCGWSLQGGESEMKGSFLSAVSGLVSGAAATFHAAVKQCVHAELPEMHQLAVLFHVAATALQQVGSDVDKAQRITDMTVDYACDNYGDYIAANGGLENVVKQP